MIAEEETTVGKYLSRHKVVLDDEMYNTDQEQYYKLLDDKPWKKE